jgi:superfamily II DNA or RNA helicase
MGSTESSAEYGIERDVSTESDHWTGPLPGIHPAPGFSYRRGQEQFLRRLAAAFQRGEMNHLGVFVPGYGKTITALSSFVVAFNMGVAEKLVVFVPRGNLRDQYADPQELGRFFQAIGAPPFSYCVADSEKVFLKNLHTQIIITTYQYASGRGGHRALLEYCNSGRCMFVFDEVHHLSDDGLWASRIEQFPHTSSVALSGTPMRSDNKTLFGVPFEMDAEGDQFYVALHEVTLRDAHAEGRILKRVDAHVIDYRLKMVREDTGEVLEMSLSGLTEIARDKNEIDAYLARQKLRFHEVYLETLLGPAFEIFAQKRAALAAESRGREGIRDHQMLVIAMSNKHAAAILEFIERRFPQFSSARIGQDVPVYECAFKLNDYREGRIDVMVQVDMIGEGTDIKPISVIVKADLVRAYSKTMQQIFRGMRYFDQWSEDANRCDIYAANDSGVVDTLEWITSEEQIGIKSRKKRENAAPPERTETERSAWHLKDVEHRTMKKHTLDLFDARKNGYAVDALPPQTYVVDVNQREKDLRRACADLANEVFFALQSDGKAVEIREVHMRAKQMFNKSQDELSLPELVRKKDWLERCLRSRRLL